MWPFDSLNSPSDHDMEKALDQIANGDWKATKTLPKSSFTAAPAATKPGTLDEQDCSQAKQGAKSAKSGSPAADGKAETTAKPNAPAEKAAKPAWVVKPYVTKKGVKGLIVRVGPLSAFLPEGDKDRKKAFFDAVNLLRTDAAHEIARKIG